MAKVLQLAIVDAEKCSGCGRCIAACPLPLFSFQTRAWRKTVVMQDAQHCTGCARCVPRCPVGAIAMTLAAPPVKQQLLCEQYP
jgi:NAD-dependent dihydropyrimidine dehydrogenase PreA subunit